MFCRQIQVGKVNPFLGGRLLPFIVSSHSAEGIRIGRIHQVNRNQLPALILLGRKGVRTCQEGGDEAAG